MKLYDLIQETKEEDVLTSLQGMIDERFLLIYKNVLDELRTKIVPNNQKDYIKILIGAKDNTMQVFGYDTTIQETIPLLLEPWSEWLGMEIHKRCIETYKKEYIIACCLVEMVSVENSIETKPNKKDLGFLTGEKEEFPMESLLKAIKENQ